MGANHTMKNYDVTDEQGRFVVEGHLRRNRLAIRRGPGQIWRAQLRPDQRTIRNQLAQASEIDAFHRSQTLSGEILKSELAPPSIGLAWRRCDANCSSTNTESPPMI